MKLWQNIKKYSYVRQKVINIHENIEDIHRKRASKKSE